MLAERRLTKLSARVKRGAALLDARCPGWASRIDLDRLDVGHWYGCPLGQLYGDFRHGWKSLRLTGSACVRHGFNTSWFSWFLARDLSDIEALSLLWAAEILSRRRADARRSVPPPKVQVPVLV